MHRTLHLLVFIKFVDIIHLDVWFRLLVKFRGFNVISFMLESIERDIKTTLFASRPLGLFVRRWRR